MIQLVFAHCGTAFGSHDGMPWPHISQDFKNFKKWTTNTKLVMGAKTFMSLPGLLPDRDHIVACNFSRTAPKTKDGSKAYRYANIDHIYDRLEEWSKDELETYSIIGGAELLKIALPYANIVYESQLVLKPTKEITQHLSKDFLIACQTFGMIQDINFWNISPGIQLVETIRSL
ncbi:dihydrofolate reductase [Acinetobacter phage ZZ1]|jgi:dihydrofolate reductase|uniref:dihydrofolate reductase n=2 Tax=Caudoviricetes TaxID=2731619 RepID=I3WW15_9CAUD|nr:dihydrofolate reductase [Acinetobacter phage ZZ1]AFL47685.1 dihydrofolate reductase [Acinetobacter phage ZZ1]